MHESEQRVQRALIGSRPREAVGEGFVILNAGRHWEVGSRKVRGAIRVDERGGQTQPKSGANQAERQLRGIGPDCARKRAEITGNVPETGSCACLFADRNTVRGEAILSHCSLAAHVPRLLDDLACSGALLRPSTNLHDIPVHCSPSLLLASFCLLRTPTALRSTVHDLFCGA